MSCQRGQGAAPVEDHGVDRHGGDPMRDPRRRTPARPGSPRPAARAGRATRTCWRPGNSTSVASGNVRPAGGQDSLKNGSFGAQQSSTGRSKRDSQVATSESSSPVQPRANAVTSRRTPASVRYGVTHGRLSAAVEVAADQPAEPEPAVAQRTSSRIGWSSARDSPGCRAEPEEHVERERREGVEGVAVGEHQAADPRGVLVEDELADRSPGVAADQHHVGEVERLEEADHDQCATPRGDRSAPAFIGRGVRAERPGRGEGAEAGFGQPLAARPTTACVSTRKPCTNTTGRPSAGPDSR